MTENGLSTPAEAGLAVQRKMIEILLSLLDDHQKSKFVGAMLDLPQLAGDNRRRIEQLHRRSTQSSTQPAFEGINSTSVDVDQPLETAHNPAQSSFHRVHPHEPTPSLALSIDTPLLAEQTRTQYDPLTAPSPAPSVAPSPHAGLETDEGANSRIRHAAVTPIDPVETKRHRQDNAELSDNLDALLLESSGLTGFAASQAGRMSAGGFERAASAPVAPPVQSGTFTSQDLSDKADPTNL